MAWGASLKCNRYLGDSVAVNTHRFKFYQSMVVEGTPGVTASYNIADAAPVCCDFAVHTSQDTLFDQGTIWESEIRANAT